MADNNRGKYPRTDAHKKRLSEGRQAVWAKLTPEERREKMMILVDKRRQKRELSTSLIA
jgi:hypothetical protein